MLLDVEQIKQDALVHVNNYIFNNVFVQPESEFRTNIKLNKLTDTPKTGIFCSSSKRIILPPYNSSYHIYSCNLDHIFGFMPKLNSWIRSDLLNTQYNICFDIYTNNGLMIPKSAVFVTAINALNRKLLIAIPFYILDNLGIPEDFQEQIDPDILYMTMFVYKNTSIKKTIYSHTPINNAFADIDDLLNNFNTSKLEVYINGINYDSSIAKYYINYSDMIDVYIDNNRVFSYEFDLNNIENYTSSNESVYKSIFHIPKDLNTDRKIYTYDEMRIFLRTENGRGVFLSYIGNPAISQLTFNDISITTQVIEALSDYLNWKFPNENVTTLAIDFYNYNNPSYFKADGNQTEKLYNNENDENIIKHLKGAISNDLDMWNANNLEISPFISDIYNYKYNNQDISQIESHIKSLGYYQYISIICPTIFKYIGLTDNDTININKPVVWKRINCIPIVYLNGIKIANDTFAYNENNNIITISFTGNISFGEEDVIIVRLLPEFNNNITIFTPTNSNNTLICNKEDLIVYVKKDTPSNPIKGYFDDPFTDYPVYKKISEIDPNDTDTWNTTAFYITQNTDPNLINIIFKDISLNNEFYIQPKYFNSYINIPFSINQRESIVFDLKDDNQINILNINYVDIFLNGKSLIKDIDYKLVELKNDQDEYRGYQIAINNMDYLNNPDNIFEIYTSSIVLDEEKIDYVVDNKIMRDGKLELWIPNLTYLIADGEIFCSDEIENKNTHLEFKNYVFDNGTLCSLKVPIPERIKDIFSEYEDAEYFSDINKINNYFLNNFNEQNPEIIIVEQPIKLYSVYLNTLINKILDGDLSSIVYSTNINDILNQISKYDFLKNFDNLIVGLNNLNLDFIDLYPSYISNTSVPNIPETMKNKYLIIHDLIRYYLGSDVVNNYHIVF